MGSVNKVTLVGRIGKDKPELSYTAQNNTACAKFSVATDDKSKDKKTQWHKIVVWGKAAEFCAKYCDGGTLVHIDGRISYSDWVDKTTGQKKYKTEIVAFSVDKLSGKKTDGDVHHHDQRLVVPAPQKEQRFSEDDIPF